MVERYMEPQRAYHTDQHLRECLTWLDEVTSFAQSPMSLELAVWYHDAVYWPRRSDNEPASADLARTHLESAGAAPPLVLAVTTLILFTTHQAPPPPGDAELLIDIDLAILGAPPDRYAEYEQQIRREYAWVPGFLFRRKRTALLQSFLARPRIYTTPLVFERLETRARANLIAATGALGGATHIR